MKRMTDAEATAQTIEDVEKVLAELKAGTLNRAMIWVASDWDATGSRRAKVLGTCTVADSIDALSLIVRQLPAHQCSDPACIVGSIIKQLNETLDRWANVRPVTAYH